MVNWENIIEFSSLLANVRGVFLTKDFHNKEVALANQFHAELIDLERNQHRDDIYLSRATYLIELSTSLEQHIQQLNADLIASTKESERDMFDQRNQQFQTIILASSVMFSALSTIIIQGYLPENLNEAFYISYALSSSLSFVFLFLSMVLCIEVGNRASIYMFERISTYAQVIRESIIPEDLSPTPDPSLGILMTNLNSSQISVEWEGHLEKIRKILYKKEKLNDQAFEAYFGEDIRNKNNKKNEKNQKKDSEKIEEGIQDDGGGGGGGSGRENSNKYCHDESTETISRSFSTSSSSSRTSSNHTCGDSNKTNLDLLNGNGNKSKNSESGFELFWKDHCEWWSNLSITFFYFGSGFLLISIGIFMWTTFYYAYHSFIGACIAFSGIGITLLISVTMYIWMRSSTNELEKNLNQKNNNQNEKKKKNP